MLRGVYTAASGMMFQMNQVDLISNNLANVATNGYKRKELIGSSFGDVLVELANQAPGTGRDIGTGIRADGIARFDTPGSLRATGNVLNLALSGPGYFLVRAASGQEVITRDGDFSVDSERQLVTRNGELVLDRQRRPIRLDGDFSNLKIDARGAVRNGEDDLGQLMVVNPPQEALDRFPVAPPGLAPVENPAIQQGYLEHSNVNVVTEMVSLMTANRNFSFGQKLVLAHDQILNKAANDLGRIQ